MKQWLVRFACSSTHIVPAVGVKGLLHRLRLRLRLREYRSLRLLFSFGSSSRCRFFLSFPRSWVA